MSVPLYQIELLDFRGKGVYATVRIQKLDSGYVSEWWVSRSFEDNLQLCGSLSVALIAETLEDAERVCGLMADEVMDFMVWAGQGPAGVGGSADEYRRAHCKYHLTEQADFLPGYMSITARTATLYLFATQFNINNPAALIAQVEGIKSVRTIHERVAYARKQGLLDRPGQGNIRAKASEVEVEAETESESKDYGHRSNGFTIYNPSTGTRTRYSEE